jgi:hypothetical protein
MGLEHLDRHLDPDEARRQLERIGISNSDAIDALSRETGWGSHELRALAQIAMSDDGGNLLAYYLENRGEA